MGTSATAPAPAGTAVVLGRVGTPPPAAAVPATTGAVAPAVTEDTLGPVGIAGVPVAWAKLFSGPETAAAIAFPAKILFFPPTSFISLAKLWTVASCA